MVFRLPKGLLVFAESMGLTHDNRKASVDPVSLGCRKTTKPRIYTEKGWRRMNGGAFRIDQENDIRYSRG